MKFRSRLVITNSILVLVVAILLGLFFRHNSIAQQKEIAYRDLQVISENASHQLDMTVKSMELVGDFLLSGDYLLSDSIPADSSTAAPLAQIYVARARRNIQLALTAYYIGDDFYRVSVINTKGDLITQNTRMLSIADTTADPLRLPDIEEINRLDNAFVLSAPHPDTWAAKDGEMVFSMTRAFQTGDTLTYIEVQKLQQDLQGIFKNSKGSRFAVIDQNGMLFFSQLTDEQNRIIGASASDGTADMDALQHALSDHDGSIISSYYSPYTSLHTVAVQDMDAMQSQFSYINSLTIGVIIASGVLSILLVTISSSCLTAPIRRLTAKMRGITLETIPAICIEGQDSKDEFAVLNQAYSQMLERLNQAAIREKELSVLQLQAEFDALQSQVDPHFIYNILNVISYRGVLSGNDITCELCGDLASMLRYSTGTARRLVKIKDEVAYVQNYLNLLRARYQDKLMYRIEIDPAIEDIQIPKIVLQQIVENSINHGYKDSADVMRILITGFAENGYWYLKVEDNGAGFQTDAMETVSQKLAAVREKIGTDSIHADLEFGGMGLMNCYARMLLLYREDFVFEFYNNDSGVGAIVIIGARIDGGEIL